MRWLDGFNDEALTVVGTDVRELITGADFDGDTAEFYLKILVLTNEHASAVGVVELADQDEGALTAANQRGAFIVGPKSTEIFRFEGPGIKFTTNLVAGVDAGTFNAYSQYAGGYLVR